MRENIRNFYNNLLFLSSIERDLENKYSEDISIIKLVSCNTLSLRFYNKKSNKLLVNLIIDDISHFELNILDKHIVDIISFFKNKKDIFHITKVSIDTDFRDFESSLADITIENNFIYPSEDRSFPRFIDKSTNIYLDKFYDNLTYPIIRFIINALNLTSYDNYYGIKSKYYDNTQAILFKYESYNNFYSRGFFKSIICLL